MKIVLDARFLGPEGTGIGRYTEKLLENLQLIDQTNDYWIVLRTSNFDLFTPTNPNFRKVIADARWYSVKEQLLIPKILLRLKPDLVHFPHFNIPLAYRGKYVVTIHDLIKSDFAGKAASTRAPLVYWTKHFVYERLVRQAVRQARRVIVPTNTIKDKVVAKLGTDPEKILVTYEAADEKFFQWGESPPPTNKLVEVLKKYQIKQPFIIYVGNAYPYKNLGRLLKALKLLPDNIQLVNPSARSVFYERLAEQAKDEGLSERVILPGYVPDEDLAVLYHAAEAYVFPTLSEGFGIPALEAMASRLPVVCSDIPVLREVCGDNALYFDPTSETDMADKINSVLKDKKLREQLIREGLERARQFSWRKMAAQTLGIYQEAVA